MIEIKFRGQRKYSEEWNYLNLVEFLTSDGHGQPDMLQYLHRNISQYTGLKDKNVIEIYEGDILSEKWRAEVYKDSTGAFMVKFHTNPAGNRPTTLLSFLKHRKKSVTEERDCVIIGNIHDNPELLK